MRKGKRMITEEIREELFSLSDGKYRDFQAPLIPSVKKERIIGLKNLIVGVFKAP